MINVPVSEPAPLSEIDYQKITIGQKNDDALQLKIGARRMQYQ